MFIVPHFSVKSGVNFAGIRAEMVPAFLAAYSVFAQHSTSLTITSALDSKHGTGSLHYVGLALDVRTRHIPQNGLKKKIADEIRVALGPQYDVILEKTHIHIEFQPK